MVASVYAYYSHLYARFNSVDFSQWILYTGDGTLFEPTEERYVLLFVSSYQEPIDQILLRLDNRENLPVLALDLSQSRSPSQEGVIFVTSGINTLLNYVRRFQIFYVPTALVIERQSGSLYKQDSLPLEL